MSNEPLTASQRLAVALGRPIPPPMTEEELRELHAKMEAAEEAAERFYKIGRYAE